ncbi:MAG: DUF479 domain-containing protein [Chitinivibrionales bacterium]|nr:DUF479 domain-containing protein [Chitinivibrionales bacterium]
MNFLAHLLLADNTTEARIGSVLADFTRTANERLEAAFGPGIAAGVMQHRLVDAFTDKHPIVNHCAGLLFDSQRHAGRIVVDILFDHYLSVYWERFSTLSREAFIERCHESLLAVDSLQCGLPERFRLFARRYVEHQVLDSYATVDGVVLALERVARRVSCENRLASAAPDIECHYEALRDGFLSFFPLLKQAFAPHEHCPPDTAQVNAVAYTASA